MPPSLSKGQILANLTSTPLCIGLEEQESASVERENLRVVLISSNTHNESEDNASSQISLILSTPLGIHLAYGLAYTVGSALGSIPPSVQQCFAAFTTMNKVKLTAGARAWSKHAHRSLVDVDQSSQSFVTQLSDDQDSDAFNIEGKQKKGSALSASTGWWGTPSGPVSIINENALRLFWKINDAATWRNLHWLPHLVLVYEIRVKEGYGMRWSQDQSNAMSGVVEELPWIFRGFVEPMMENGHERGWRHAP